MTILFVAFPSHFSLFPEEEKGGIKLFMTVFILSCCRCSSEHRITNTVCRYCTKLHEQQNAMNADPKKGKGRLSNRLTSMKVIPCLDQDLTEKEGKGKSGNAAK